MFRATEKNYMQTKQLEILKTLRTAAKKQPTHEFDIANVRYLENYLDPNTKKTVIGGLEVMFDFYPNGRSQGGNLIEPIRIPFVYSLPDTPTLEQLYVSINEDFAMFTLANKYPALNIRGISSTSRCIEVANPFSDSLHIPVKILNDCLNLSAGTFDVTKYVEVANHIITNNVVEALGPDAMTRVVPQHLIKWNSREISSLGVTVLLAEFTELEEVETADNKLSLRK